MPQYYPVEYDPWAADAPQGPVLIPIEHDPFLRRDPAKLPERPDAIGGAIEWLGARGLFPTQGIASAQRDLAAGGAAAARGNWPESVSDIGRGIAHAAGDTALLPMAALAAPEAAGTAIERALSLKAGYNAPDRALRAFAEDYPAGATADAAGNLTRDIEGRPLVAKRNIGRSVVGGDDNALSETQLDTFATEVSGERAAFAPRRKLGGASGQLRIDIDRRSGDRRYRISLADDLAPDEAGRVYRHEIGHVIDDIAGKIDTAGIEQSELLPLYNTLNKPFRNGAEAATWGKSFRPTDAGYSRINGKREMIAEAIRAYMENPNYLKTVAPKTAARIRANVNGHPTLSRIVQFNSLVAGGQLLPVDYDPFAPPR